MDTSQKVQKQNNIAPFLFLVLIVTCIFVSIIFYQQKVLEKYTSSNSSLSLENTSLLRNIEAQKNFIASKEAKLSSLEAEFSAYRQIDQILINKKLEEDLTKTHEVFLEGSKVYEDLQDLKLKMKNTSELDKLYVKFFDLLSNHAYTSASAQLAVVKQNIKKEEDKLVSSFNIPTSIILSNTAPNSGFSRQKVLVNEIDYMVDIFAADTNSYKFLVDTANDSDCKDNCPTKNLHEYISRNGAVAGINGSYFCPASYPSCSGKTNSFDTLIRNKSGTLFNVDNNVYSTVPGVRFQNGQMNFYTRTLDYGKDGESYIANRPLLVLGGQALGNADDIKQSSKGPRCFVGNKGSIGYIGIVYNASTGEAAQVLKTIGLDNALNLDSGGSTALWVQGGYKAGPGRSIPSAIVIVKR